MTLLYGILGHPLGHTLSPSMQNAAFAALGVEAHYVPLAIPPDRIRAALEGLKSSGFAGFNVTVPYKETVLPFLDGRSAEVRAAGAVNTIVARRGLWIGHNTDVFGFNMLLKRAKIRFKNAHVLVFGAGGVARAGCATLLPAVRSIRIHNRTRSRARALKDSFPRRYRSKIFLSGEKNSRGLPPADLLINATSIGLNPHDRFPAPRGLFENAVAAVDLIYNPPLTDFLRRAKKAGCKTANGLDMLLYQGARAFELWTGRRAPVDAMRRALLKAVRC